MVAGTQDADGIDAVAVLALINKNELSAHHASMPESKIYYSTADAAGFNKRMNESRKRTASLAKGVFRSDINGLRAWAVVAEVWTSRIRMRHSIYWLRELGSYF